MYQFPSGVIKLKTFVKETGSADPHKEPKADNDFTVTPLTGDKAKEFYENILKESAVPEGKKCPVKPAPKVKKTGEKAQKKTFKNADLLRLAQNNDVENLSVFFAQETDYDLNVVDDFGWTPLMCAACSGAEEAVGILLEYGADPYKRDRLGNTALKLASRRNQTEIVKKLINYKRESEVVENESTREAVEAFFCSVCKENLTMSKNKHECSTLHLFNSNFKSATFYGIPECNKGFQLLLREGWDKEKGLGPDGTGRKFPVKAVMKKDRLGVGARPPTPHKNKPEPQRAEKYDSKRGKLYKKWKEKDFEKNFRLEFT